MTFLLSGFWHRCPNGLIAFTINIAPPASMQHTFELIIDEATSGHFFWTLVRHVGKGAKPLVVDFAMEPLPSREAALNAGSAWMTRRRVGGWEAPWGRSSQSAETVPMEL